MTNDMKKFSILFIVMFFSAQVFAKEPATYPEDLDPGIRTAFVKLIKKDPSGITEFEDMIKTHPDEWAVYLIYGNGLSAAGDFKAGKTVFERALANPKIEKEWGQEIREKIAKFDEVMRNSGDTSLK